MTEVKSEDTSASCDYEGRSDGDTGGHQGGGGGGSEGGYNLDDHYDAGYSDYDGGCADGYDGYDDDDDYDY